MGEPLRPTSAWHNAQLHFGQSHTRGFRRDTGMGDQRQFQTPAQRGAMNGGNHRLGGALDDRLKVAQFRPLSRLSHGRDVRPCMKGPPGTGDDNAPHACVGIGPLQPCGHSAHHRVGQGVDGRIVGGDHGDAVLDRIIRDLVFRDRIYSHISSHRRMVGPVREAHAPAFPSRSP